METLKPNTVRFVFHGNLISIIRLSISCFLYFILYASFLLEFNFCHTLTEFGLSVMLCMNQCQYFLFFFFVVIYDWLVVSLQIHLFDIDIPGKITFIESKTLTAGETPTIVDTGLTCSFNTYLGICFPVLSVSVLMQSFYSACVCNHVNE